MNIENIKPDSSGKYSPLLYKWLVSKRFINARSVFQSGSFVDRSVFSEQWRPREIIIGTNYKDGFVGGRNLGDIICGERGVKSVGYAYSVIGFNLRDITDEFWSAYERDGRCAWDHSHSIPMVGDESRWIDIGGVNRRECQWCGKVFEAHKKIDQSIEFKERVIWNEYKHIRKSSLLYPMGSMGEAA